MEALGSQRQRQKNAIAGIVSGFCLLLICITASAVRLFSVIKYESVIHEFDPYFNYRVTQYAVKKGLYDMWDWFDDRTWYPLGRVIGGTMYPVRLVARVRRQLVCFYVAFSRPL